MTFATSLSVADYWNGFVEENIRDWRHDMLSVRRALNAAIAIHHTADYVATHKSQNAIKYRESIRNDSTSPFLQSFLSISDLVDTYKHCRLEKRNRMVFSNTSTNEIGGAYSSAAFSSASYAGGTRTLCVQIVYNGTVRNVEFQTMLDDGREFWISPEHGEFSKLGISI